MSGQKPVIDLSELPDGYRVLPPSKTARVQLLVTPERKQQIKNIAAGKGVSVNALLNELIENHLEEYKQ